MKKITLILAFIGMISLGSCSVDNHVNNVDNDTISAVIEITTSFNSGNNFSRLITITPQIFASDMILVYRLYDVVNGADVWQLIPQTYYLDGGNEIDYNYDFTVNDVNIFMGANFDLNTLSSIWTQNQTFRIVIVPGYFSGKAANPVNFNDYNAVVNAFQIDDSNIKKRNK